MFSISSMSKHLELSQSVISPRSNSLHINQKLKHCSAYFDLEIWHIQVLHFVSKIVHITRL